MAPSKNAGGKSKTPPVSQRTRQKTTDIPKSAPPPKKKTAYEDDDQVVLDPVNLFANGKVEEIDDEVVLKRKTPQKGKTPVKETPKEKKTPAAKSKNQQTPATANKGQKTPAGKNTPDAGKTPKAQQTPALKTPTSKTPKKEKTTEQKTPLTGKTPKDLKIKEQKSPTAGKTAKGQTPVKPVSAATPKGGAKTPKSQTPGQKTPGSKVQSKKPELSDESNESDDDDDEMDDFAFDDDDDSDLESVDENIQTKIDKLKELNSKMQKGKIDLDDDDEEQDDDDDDDDDDSFDEAELEKQILKKLTDKNSSEKNNSKANDNKKQLTSKTDSKNVIDKKGKTSPKPGGTSKDDADKVDPQQEELDRRTLFVSHIKYSETVEDVLRNLSKDVQSVRVRPARKRHNKVNDSQGYAFLEFANEKFAEKNFKILKGKTIDGKEILVDYVGSKSEHKKPKRKIKETGNTDPLRLYVGSYKLGTTETDLRKLFTKSVKIDRPLRKDGKPMGFSFVQFATESLAKQAYEKMQGHVLNGNRLIVDYAKSKKPSEKPQEAQKRKTSTDIKGPQTKKAKSDLPKMDVQEEDDDDDDDDSDEDENDEDDIEMSDDEEDDHDDDDSD